MHIHVFPLHDYFTLLILIFPLLDMWAVDMRCVEPGAMWAMPRGSPLESHISYFSFPVILLYAINRAQALLSCYMWIRYYTGYCYRRLGTLLFLIHVPLVHGYTNSQNTVISYIVIIVTGCLIHSYIMFTHHCYTCMYYFYILVIWITIHIACLIVACIFLYSCCMIVSRYWYSRYWIRELLIYDVWNPISIVSRFLLSCFMLSTKLMSCYRVTCIMYCSCSWYSVYIKCVTYYMGLGETWRLTRSCRVDV